MMLLASHKYIVRTALAYVLLLGMTASISSGQSENSRLVKADDPQQITDAVMISSVTVSGMNIQCGLFIKPPSEVQSVAPFAAAGNWLQNMDIALVNRTVRDIMFGALTIQFLDTGDCRRTPCAATELHFGQLPPVDAYYGNGEPIKPESINGSTITWTPGKTLVIHVGDYRDQIEQALSGQNLNFVNVNRIALHIGPFFFRNGMRWALGFYSKPDPDRPGRFKYLPSDYFPGARGQNWPPGFNQ